MTTLPKPMPGAEPFFYRGREIGCLCLHGFTAAPAEVRWLGQHLAEQGMTVYGPRLPGHGVDPREMIRQCWHDWYLCALDGYHILRQQCEKVFVFGHSMGGTLALLLGSEVAFDGMIVSASPVWINSRIIRHTRWLKYAVHFAPFPDKSHVPQLIREEQARRGEAVVGRVHYARWSVSAISELYRMTNLARTRLPQITAPLMLLYAIQDEGISVDQQQYIAQHVSTESVEQHVFHKSTHALTQDVERHEVFKHTADFIARHSR